MHHTVSLPSRTTTLSLLLILLSTAVPLPRAWAQEGVVEEIVVTSTRLRTESLQDSPVVVAVLRGDELANLNLLSLEDISHIVPSVELDPGRSDGLYIRGVGSGGDTGFDQSVGIVVDDIPFSRGRWLNPAYLDVAQVEVLKGPQGVYLGKNATAGAIYIRSNDPGQAPEFSVEGGTEFEANEVWGEAILSGPLSDTVGARLAVRASEMDGWFQQLSTDTPQTEELAGRLTVAWDVADKLRNVTKFTYNDRDDAAINVSTQRQSCQGPGGTVQPTFGLLPSPGEDCRVDDKSTLDDETPADYGEGRYWKHESWLLTNRLEWRFDNFTLTSISGLSDYDTKYLDDYDFASSPSIYAYEEEQNEQFNQEFRVATELNGRLNLLAGIFYEDTDFHHRNSSVLFNQAFLDIISGGTIPLADPATGRNFLWDRSNRQDGESWGGFAELSWDISDRWRLDVGGRYTDVSKDSVAVNTYVHSIVGVFVFPVRPVGDALADDYRDDDFSPQVILSWHPTDNVMVFASYTEAFKAGGFAHGSTLLPGLTVDDVTYDAESAKGYTLGIKTTLLDGRLFLSAAAYYNEFTDLQQSQFNSETTSFTVANAGTNEVMGLDVEINWDINEHFTLNASTVLLDSEIDDYIGTCFAGQTVEQGCDVGYDPNTPSGTFSFTPGVAQDRSGIELAPDLELNLGLQYHMLLETGASVRADVFMRYRDEVYLQPARDYPSYDEYTRWDASLVYDSPSDRWQLRLYGKNLTNEKILAGWVDSPGTGGTAGLPAGTAGAGRWADLGGGIQRTRELGMALRFRF
jgi:outer membrane receptor protein involved in Fe transport